MMSAEIRKIFDDIVHQQYKPFKFKNVWDQPKFDFYPLGHHEGHDIYIVNTHIGLGYSIGARWGDDDSEYSSVGLKQAVDERSILKRHSQTAAIVNTPLKFALNRLLFILANNATLMAYFEEIINGK